MSVSNSQILVLVVGGSGFMGSHIILQLLDAGYRVRATVRPGKTEEIKNTYPNAGEKLEIAEVEDIVKADFKDIIKGVGAVVHAAMPVTLDGSDAAVFIQNAILGTLNVMEQAVKEGIKKIVLISSFGALFDPDMGRLFQKDVVDETSWGNASEEDAKEGKRDIGWAYVASKSIAEKKAWEFIEKYPEVDLITLLPAMVYGPYVPNYPPRESRSKLGSNEHVYHLIEGAADGSKTYPFIPITHFVDVRDVAKASVLSLKAPASLDPMFVAGHAERKRKRLILVGGNFGWVDAGEYLKDARPTLRGALEKVNSGPAFGSCAITDMDMTEKVVGMGMENMIGWKECILDTVDALLKWKSVKGL